MPDPTAGVSYDVVGIGNAIVDVLARTDDAFLDERGLVKGTMRLCSPEEAETLYGDMPPATERSGGSVANALVGLASFGGRAAFAGKVRDDELGRVFAHDITAAGVAFVTPMAPPSSPLPTGRSLILVTPDAERTMNTSLGIAGALTLDDVPDDVVEAASVVLLEGFLWDEVGARDAMVHAAGVARRAGRQVAFSLSDPFCVDRHRDAFQSFVSSSVDVLFANEAELVSLFGVGGFDDAMAEVRSRARCSVLALTRGAKGSVLVAGDDVYLVDAAPTTVVDTTGAGDLYAAGVLYGLTHGLTLETAGRIGALAAAEVISHVGARPDLDLRELAAGLL